MRLLFRQSRFYPSSGIISPGSYAIVYISIPDTACPAAAGLTFTGPANSASVSWSCSLPPQPPSLAVSRDTLDQSDCTTNDNGNTYQCSLTISETSDSQGNANWYMHGKYNESFNPQNGTLSPGGSTQVTITGIPCQSDTFTFGGYEGEQPISTMWSCTQPIPSPSPSPSPSPIPPVLTISPSSLDTSQCSSSDGGNTYQCSVTIGETSDSQGNANWSIQGGQNETFSQQSGQLSPGGSTPVTISGIPCQNDSFTVSGNENEQSVTAAWSCSPTPTSSSSPTPTDTPTPTPTSTS